MISPSQILISIIVLFIIFRTLVAFKKKDLSLGFVVVWLSIWVGVLFFVFEQRLLSTIANSLGLSRGVDLVIYIALIVVFYLIYRILIYLKDLERKVTLLVRKIAIEKRPKNK